MIKIKKYDQFLSEKVISADIKLPNDIIEISKAYIKAGKDIFLVGGAVRDYINGVKPKDFDLVTNALPDESKVILKGFNVSDEQGKNFGVLRVYTKDEPEGYEIASYRRDISGGRDTKGDDQKVEMGGDVTIADDCNRRDLTMNALFYNIKTKEIVDLVGGVSDIKNGIVRAVGDASQRFIEDRLRILRVFRFTSRIGGKIDIQTANAIRKDNRLRGIDEKSNVSQERIWDEMKKAAKQAKNYSEYLEFFNEFDMWDQVFPGAKINTKIEKTDSFISYIANLFKFDNISDLEKRMVLEYKIEYDTASKVVFLINLLKLTPELAFDLYKQKVKCHCSTDLIVDWLDINDINDKMFIKFMEYKPSVSAEELMSKGFKGKELGDEIKRQETEKFKQML